MRASPNGVPLSAADSTGPLSGLLTLLMSLLVEMYVLTGRGDIAVWPSGDTS